MEKLIKPCKYCGSDVEKPLTRSLSAWESRSPYCSRECYFAARRCDLTGYLGRYLDLTAALPSGLQNALQPYMSIPLARIMEIASGGISPHGNKTESKLYALAVACALSDMNPDMFIAPDVVFDYRMLLKTSKYNAWPGGCGVKVALKMSGMSKEDFIEWVGARDNEEKTRLVQKLNSLFGEWGMDKLYGEDKWVSALKETLSRVNVCTGSLAYLLAQNFALLGVQVDYRMFLEEVRPPELLARKSRIISQLKS